MKPVPHGEPYAGKLHVRFDEGAGVPDNKGRPALLYTLCLPVRQKRGRISHGKLLRNSNLDKDAFKRVVETLIESGTLRKEYGDRGGVFYVLAE